MKLFKLLLLLPLLFVFACDTGDGNKSIFINGEILNFGEFGSIEVEVIEDDRTRDSDDVNDEGDFNLNFNADSGLVTLRFITDDLTISRQNFSVTDDSTIVLDVTINQNPAGIVFNTWDVTQDPISINNDDEIIFVETDADFTINGDNNNCIRTRGSSFIRIEANTIDILDCDEGVRAEDDSEVILRSSQSLSISSESNGVRARNQSIVNIGQTLNPIDNSVEVRSFEADGVNTTGTAEVTFTPQNNNCTIQGSDSAVNEGSDSVVDTDGCTLVDG